MRQLVFLPLIVAAFFTNNLYSADYGSLQLFVKTLSGKTITIDISPSDSVAELKRRIYEKENIAIESQKIIYAGQDLADHTLLSDTSCSKHSTLHLVISLEAAHDQKYEPKYLGAIKNARAVLRDLRGFEAIRALSNSNFYVEIQTMIFGLDSLFSYKLPGNFLVEVAADLSSRYNLSLNDLIQNKDELYAKAMTYLKTYATGCSEEVVINWKRDPELFKTYLMCRIAYNISLAKMLGDEKINNVFERFFPEGRQSFIDIYNEKEPLNFVSLLDKYDTIHWREATNR